jgi:peptide/nickel transport system substrate-binding protein
MPALRLLSLRPVAAGLAVLAVLGAVGCTSGTGSLTGTGAPKGELSVLALGPVDTWDPQRMSSPQDAAFAGRVFSRTLTAFPASTGGNQAKVVGDLAMDSGSVDSSLRVWTFTLRDNVRWQDGSAVTCEDVRYGIARSFAAPFSTVGLNYPLAYLDIPRKPDGTSTYAGPYAGADQAPFDQAVSCQGPKITFHLTVPMGDFNQVLSLPPFAPVKKSADKGKAGTYAVFSNGPYELKGDWDPNTGGTFVRNPHWDRASDPIRKAQPAVIRYVQGTETQTAVQEVVNDDGEHRQSVTFDSAPPAMQQHVLSDDALRARSVNPDAQFVDYLAPNIASGVMKDPDVRLAFALATNREGYIAALGGSSAASPAYTLIGPGVPGHRDADPTGAGPSGASGAARAALQKSGLTLPVKVRVSYRSTPTADKAMAALANGWQDAGFAVQLQPIAKDYFTVISGPGQAAKTDVFWANWAPAWPSAATVIPPLLDSRLNLTSAGTGRDVGGFGDVAVNAEITRISALPDPGAQATAWADLDASLARRGAFIALAQRKALYVAGSGVSGLAASQALGGFVDLAAIGLR